MFLFRIISNYICRLSGSVKHTSYQKSNITSKRKDTLANQTSNKSRKGTLQEMAQQQQNRAVLGRVICVDWHWGASEGSHADTRGGWNKISLICGQSEGRCAFILKDVKNPAGKGKASTILAVSAIYPVLL